MFFNRGPDIRPSDRLSDVKLNDLLDDFRKQAGLPLLSLRVKQNSSVSSVKEEMKSLEPEAIELELVSEFSDKKDDEYCLVDSDIDKSCSITSSALDVKAEASLDSSPGFFTINYFIYEETYSPTISASGSENKTEAKTEAMKKKFVVFFTTRDQDQSRQEKFEYLLLANQVIKAYQENFPSDSATLLLPIVQCGMYMKLDKIPFESLTIGSRKIYDSSWVARDHFVTAAVSLPDKKITIYDSQSYRNSMLYFQWLITPGFETIYENLGTQIGSNLCGYYTFMIINSYLKTGDSKKLSSIGIDPNLIKDREHFLKNWKTITDHILENKPLMLEVPIKESKLDGIRGLI